MDKKCSSEKSEYDDFKDQKGDGEPLRKDLEDKKCMPQQLEDSLSGIDSIRDVPDNDKEREIALLDKIAFLEKELEDTTKNADLKFDKVKIMFEEQIEITRRNFKSSQYDLEYMLRSAQASLESRRIELNTILENQRMTIEFVHKVEGDMTELQNKLAEMEKANKKLEMTLVSRDKTISKLKFQSYTAKCKVAEACKALQQAMLEKDAAMVREKYTQDEIVKLILTLGDIVKDSTLMMPLLT